ncbi:MAG: hypothetical protein JXR78_15455 [Victivallales bacterium]|nr:hypothetical protein [Victivallales bacterium]
MNALLKIIVSLGIFIFSILFILIVLPVILLFSFIMAFTGTGKQKRFKVKFGSPTQFSRGYTVLDRQMDNRADGDVIDVSAKEVRQDKE